MTALTVHAARSLLDASTANGGAIDGALLPLASLDVLLTLVALGIAIAQQDSAKPAVSLAVVFAVAAGSAIAGLRDVALPAADTVRLCASLIIVAAAVLGRRLTWWLAAVGGALFVAGLVATRAAESSIRGIDYAASFSAALALSVTAIVLGATAVGFMCIRSPRALLAARAVVVLAGAATLATAVRL